MGKSTLLKTLMAITRSPRPEAYRRWGCRSVVCHRIGIARRAVPIRRRKKSPVSGFDRGQNLQLGLRDERRHRSRQPAPDRRIFPVLVQRLSKMPGTLSGGEQKMPLVARPDGATSLLLIDEISEGLQPSAITRLAEVFRHKGVSAAACRYCWLSRKPFALAVADRYANAEPGRDRRSGQPDERDSLARINRHLVFE